MRFKAQKGSVKSQGNEWVSDPMNKSSESTAMNSNSTYYLVSSILLYSCIVVAQISVVAARPLNCPDNTAGQIWLKKLCLDKHVAEETCKVQIRPKKRDPGKIARRKLT